MKEVHVPTLEELPLAVKDILWVLKDRPTTKAVVLALHGDLGAGKTTFVQELGRQLGITESITSPTFTIMKQYELESAPFVTLIHIDAYRIKDTSEMAPLHFSSILSAPETLVCIEWAEHVSSLLPVETIHLHFTSTLGKEGRTITIDGIE